MEILEMFYALFKTGVNVVNNITNAMHIKDIFKRDAVDEKFYQVNKYYYEKNR